MSYHFISFHSNNNIDDSIDTNSQATLISKNTTISSSTDFSDNFLHIVQNSYKISNQIFYNMQRDTIYIKCNARFFIHCNFESLQFHESNFSFCTFYNCNFYDCLFLDCSLETMGLFNCAFTDCTIQESILNYSRFIDGTISSLYIEDCNLQGTMFYLDTAHTRNIMTNYSNNEDAYFNE